MPDMSRNVIEEEVMDLQRRYQGSIRDLIEELGIGQDREEYMDPVLDLEDMKRLRDELEERVAPEE
jgi:FAD/FMN-containing dehydrogenase